MTLHMPKPGEQFSKTTIARLGGGNLTLGEASKGYDWQLIVVYRGAHCPICTRYLSEIGAITPELDALNIEVVAVSADSVGRHSILDDGGEHPTSSPTAGSGGENERVG